MKTHIRLWNCPANFKNLAIGKEKYPSRAYEVVVDNSRRILHTTGGFWGSYSDKTIVYHDKLVMAIQRKQFGADIPWKLCNANGEETELTGGLYIIVDGGYPSFSQLVAAVKRSTDKGVQKWTAMLEALRKDVECTFGILKGKALNIEYVD